ncbi:MAG: hypothetical protein COT43_02255 [Candidatus Marinimicrobia bacterium CG08_land_8_20_14_0_20_45_22]|nr:MAG: hypothetical protein COT43_02255 [Candidatus Marinimicrobia bacterium CG08_land_8_20_14_0_20_45_22]
MLTELSRLVILQKIDLRLLEIKQKKGDLPQVVETLQHALQKLDTELIADTKRQKEITLEMTRLDSQIADDKQRLTKFQDQLYLVTSNKEYDALTFEIDQIKQNIDKSEYTILTLSDETDKLKESIKSKTLSRQEKSKELEVRAAELEKMNQYTKEAYEKAMAERENILEMIPLRYIREYDRIANAKEGIAVVSIHQMFEEKVDKKGNVEYIPGQVFCSGCHKIVPPQKAVEIRSGNQIIRCEFCGRMLYQDKSSENRTLNEEEIF